MNEHDTTVCVQKIEKNYSSLCQAFKEMLFSDKSIFDQIYCGVYLDSIRSELIATFLDVKVNQVICSPMSSDITEFALTQMLYDGLAKISNSICPAYSLTATEFLYFWIVLQQKGLLYTCLFDLKDTSMFIESFKKTIEAKTKNSFVEKLLEQAAQKDKDEDMDTYKQSKKKIH